MRVDHLPCGAFVNASEEAAFRAVDKYLRASPVEGRAVVLTNFAHGVGRGGQPDEIDMIVIAPGGAVVIEVKHWDRQRLKANAWEVEDQADLITAKAKRIAGRLRQAQPKLDFVPAKILLTKEGKSLRQSGQLPEVRGIRLHGLADLDALLDQTVTPSSIPTDVERLARALAPRGVAAASGELKRIGRIGELRLLSAPDERFRRVYAGRDTTSGDRVTLHVYDLSASNAANAEQLARREFETVQRLQKSPFLPILIDSFQPCPGYPGELFFFTLAESAAASMFEMEADPTWTMPAKLAFATAAFRALAELHAPSGPDSQAVVHRALTPESIRIRADGRPLFAGWRWARLPEARTITGVQGPEAQDAYAAPEVQKNGLAFADARSDVYSLCKVLREVFTEGDAEAVRSVLASGMTDDPSTRSAPDRIAEELEMLARPPSSPPPIAPQRWDEGHIVEWEGERYRVLSLLGEGGAGRTFKLEQLDRSTDEPIGAFVGKVVLNAQIGPAALEAYRKVRSIADHRCLSGIYQTAREWKPDTLMALLKWRKGEPLDGWRGDYLRLLAEEIESAGANEPEELLLQWAEDLCEALDVLHVQNWIHGDLSPSNIIVDGDTVTLIDFDLACPVGSIGVAAGTAPYASPTRRANRSAMPADDVFALAASLFHVLTDRLPFVFDGVRRDDEGLAWLNGERGRYPRLSDFLDRAVDPDQARRFETAGAALRFLRDARSAESTAARAPTYALPEPQTLRPNVVPRAKEILRAYPGSRFGNAETRGLDSEFAHDTYVETELDRLLPEAIRAGDVSLVILCGNAGDGKTAFLQHLAAELGIKELPSEQRVWDGLIEGLPVKINLDGAAAWKGRSADELLDELFQPFHHGPPESRRVHLVAVNDGRLMEWVESYESRHDGETLLTTQITSALGREGDGLDAHVRLIELNLRSLVGGIDRANGLISAEFVDRLCARLVGGDEAREIWKPCRTCSARMRCSIRISAEVMGASGDETVLRQGALLRRRLAAAFQAVHQRNEVHITARELKAALSYILFGIYACEDLHANVDLRPHAPGDFAFDPASPFRQGELLRELTRLDPALEAHARVDRYLRGHAAPDPAHGAPRYPEASLASARRRAYLEWSDDQVTRVGGDASALCLNGGRHFSDFRDFPLLTAVKQCAIRNAICRGLSRLEALPEIALRQEGVVPIRVVPRTPTETAFWVGKPLDRFTLEAEQFVAAAGLETLHRYLTLSYRAVDGRTERLIVSLELFALLMDLAEGVQILDAFSDDVFANLGVFTQRLAQEDERSLHAWNPAADNHVYHIGIEDRAAVQTIVLSPAPGEAA